MIKAKQNDPLDHRLHGVAVYNPDLLSEEELKTIFIARKDLLERFVGDLQTEKPGHKLILGVRGMGKSTFLRRLKYEILDNPQTAKRWVPLVFPEEQYNVTRLSDFFLNCLDSLADALEQNGETKFIQELDKLTAQLVKSDDEGFVTTAACDVLREMSKTIGKGLVLLVDNSERILDELSEPEEWKLRDILSEHDWLVFVGASATAIESGYQYDKPFYDFFDIKVLKGFTASETEDVLRKLGIATNSPNVIEWIDRDPARLKTLNLLSGGNPRTVVLLFQLLVQGIEGDVRSDLERLLDMCTPLYKARFEELSQQAQKVMDALALHWDPATAAEVAESARLDVTKVSSQLDRLVKQGIIEKVELPDSKRTGFQIIERFFNIWYLMRASRRVRKKLMWLVQFLKVFYSQDELGDKARDYLKALGRESTRRFSSRRAEFGFSLAEAIETPATKNALEYSTIESLVADQRTRRQLSKFFDFNADDRPLKSLAERMELMQENREKLAKNLQALAPAINQDEFKHLLLGSLGFSATAKSELINQISAANVNLLYEKLLAEKSKYNNEFHSTILVESLYKSIATGYMADISDQQGAAAVAEAKGFVELPVLVAAYRAESNQSPYDLELLKENRNWNGYVCKALGDHFERTDQFEEAETAYRKAIEIDPNFTTALNGLGNLLSDHFKRYEEAETAYRKAIEIDENYAHAFYGLANLLSDHLKRYEEAEAAYREAIKIDPDYARAHNGLGNLLSSHLNRYEEAETAYRKAIEIDSNYANAFSNLGDVLRNDRINRYEEAEAAYRMAIEIDPTCKYAYKGLGYLLKDHYKRFEEAETAFMKALEIDPNFASGFSGIGNLLMHDHYKRYEEAEIAFRRAIEIDPDSANEVNDLANLLWNRNVQRYEEAEVAYRKAIEIDPNCTFAFYNLGFLLTSDHFKRYEEAENAYRKAIDIDPNDTYAFNGLAILLQNHFKRYAEAEAAYRKAIQIDPNFSHAFANLGNLLSDHFQRYEEAEAAYRKAIEIDPNFAYAFNGLGNLLKSDHFQRYEEAEAAYRKAIEIDPNYKYAFANLGNLLKIDHFKRYEEAETAYRKAIEIEPENPQFLNGLGWYIYKYSPEKISEAEDLLRKAIEIKNDVNLYHTISCILVAQKKWFDAIPHAKRFLEADENWLETIWQDVVQFFHETVKQGFGEEAPKLLVDCGRADQWMPLVEALKAATKKEKKLLNRLAPEVRVPASAIYDSLLGIKATE